MAYEAAIEAINGAVGAYTALIAAEEAKPVPDSDAIMRARSGRSECARRRQQLNPSDLEAMAAARRQFTELASETRRAIDA